jgi:hypothetical protein
MAEMKISEIEQLMLMRQRIDEYLEKHPTNGGDYTPSFTNFKKELRQGIVFYRPGWGWRLRKDWEKVFSQKIEEFLNA